MPCRQCSAELPSGSSFCNRCGASQLDEPAAAPFPRGSTGPNVPEEHLWTGRYSLKAAAHLWILSLAWAAAVAGGYWRFGQDMRTPLADEIVLAVALLPGIVALGRTLVRRLTLKYRLTNHRLFTERGLLSREHDEIELIRVDDVSVRQNVLQRLFGVGTIKVLSTDASNPELVMEGIARPIEVKEQLRLQVRARRARTTFLESL